MSINTYAVNCNDAWLNTEGDDISGSYVKYKDHQAVVAELEAKCAALYSEKEKFAVECAATKIAIAYLRSGREDFSLNTPTTDAFLAEVRAQGGAKALEDFAEFNIKSIDPLDDEYTAVLKETARAARGFAAQLLQEAKTAELVAAGIITKVGE